LSPDYDNLYSQQANERANALYSAHYKCSSDYSRNVAIAQAFLTNAAMLLQMLRRLPGPFCKGSCHAPENGVRVAQTGPIPCQLLKVRQICSESDDDFRSRIVAVSEAIV
jgi:hypothetical protein